jgi:hypothetical protein
MTDYRTKRSHEKRATRTEKLLADARSGETRRFRSAWRTDWFRIQDIEFHPPCVSVVKSSRPCCGRTQYAPTFLPPSGSCLSVGGASVRRFRRAARPRLPAVLAEIGGVRQRKEFSSLRSDKGGFFVSLCLCGEILLNFLVGSPRPKKTATRRTTYPAPPRHA